MAFKFAVFLGLFSIAYAGSLPVGQVYHAAAPAPVYHAAAGPVYHQAAAPVYHAAAAPVYHQAAAPVAVAQQVLTKDTDSYDPHPQYSFAYDIQDHLSGDSKSQVESRDGDIVKGQYSLTDADGYRRTVDYTSDPHNGFNAVVSREPLVKTAAVAAAPAIIKSAPIAYSH